MTCLTAAESPLSPCASALLTSNLPQLQNLIKRDPAGYREEFMQQWNHYESMRRLFELNPDEEGERFREVITFISQVRPSFPSERTLAASVRRLTPLHPAL